MKSLKKTLWLIMAILPIKNQNLPNKKTALMLSLRVLTILLLMISQKILTRHVH